MFFKSSFHLLTKISSIVALTIGLTPPTSAQTGPFLSGVGASSIASSSLILNWFDPPPGQFNDGGFSTYEAAGSAAGRTLFGTPPDETDFVASTFIVPRPTGNPNIPIGFVGDSNIDPNWTGDIIVVNPIDVPIVLPYNTDFNNNGLNDFELRLTTAQVCRIFNGSISNWNQLGGPNAPIRRIFRSDTAGTTALVNRNFIQPFCGFSIANPLGNVTISRDSNDITIPLTVGVISTIASTPGSIGYSSAVVARDLGRVDSSFVLFTDRGNQRIAASGPIFFGFFNTYPRTRGDAARELCRYILEEGRTFAISQGYLPPSVNGDGLNAIGQPVLAEPNLTNSSVCQQIFSF